MKVGILSREYPPLTHVGGIATYSAAAARLMADHGHEVHVVCNGPRSEAIRADGVTVHRVPMLRHHFPEGRLLYPWRAAYRKHLPHYLDALTWARTAAQYLSGGPGGIDAESFDLWEYPETMGEGALLPQPSAEGPRRPRRICRIHTGWMDDYADNALERRLLLSLQRKACRRADRVVSPSRAMAGRYARDVLRLPGPVAVSPNPIRLWEAPIDWDTKRAENILYVGRVEWRKGLQVLLGALDDMGETAAGLTLRVVGHRYPPTRAQDRACLEMFEARLAGPRAYGLEYAGPCAHEEMRRHYDWAGIQVLPSLVENYPYAALEGLSRGCILVGSEVGGLPEILDRPSRGSLFPAENRALLARIMGELRERARDLPADQRRNAEEMRAEFGPEACYRRLLEAYDTEDPEGAERGSIPLR